MKSTHKTSGKLVRIRHSCLILYCLHVEQTFSKLCLIKKKQTIFISQGANKEIREAIADPSPEVQAKAWSAVLPLVIKLKRCYEHSLELDKIVPKLLGQLVGGKLNPTQHLETQQALVKQLAEILEFVLKFDEYKVSYTTVILN